MRKPNIAATPDNGRHHAANKRTSPPRSKTSTKPGHTPGFFLVRNLRQRGAFWRGYGASRRRNVGERLAAVGVFLLACEARHFFRREFT